MTASTAAPRVAAPSLAAPRAAPARDKPASPLVSHPALTASVMLGAAAVVLLTDTVFGEYVRAWTFEARTGLHHWSVPAVAIAGYLTMVAVLPRLMRDREPLGLKGLMLVHNYILSTGSLAATFAVLREVVPFFASEQPLVNAVCDPARQHPTTPIYFWYFVFYLSKMYEFGDTAILILRKKPLIFLHVYHHVITLALCWLMLDDRMAIQWLSTSANTLIHTFMYYFYACQSVGLDVWWKRYLTQAQIVQFIIGNVGNASWSYFKVGLGLDCSGSWLGFWFGIGVIASFLLLFIKFYARSYSAKRPAAAKGTVPDHPKEE